MPIQEENIVFLKSQVMDDVPEGGGAATRHAVPDGVMNNVFEDISDLDRAYGRFNLRKLFLAVRSLDTDLYGGAKTVITALPQDPAVSYALFTTNDPFDTRTQAANRVESYLFKGPMWHGALYENHIAGMRAISVIQDLNTALPPIGKTLCIVENEGLSGEKEQYVRVIDVSVTTHTFHDGVGAYQRWIVRMELSDALVHNFTGHTPVRSNVYNYSGRARIRDTVVADATRYFGAQPLVQAAAIGDLKVRARSMFTQLVPSAQTETPLLNQVLNPARAAILPSAANTVTYSAAGAAFAPNGRFVCRSGVTPGTLLITLSSITITDNGAGRVMQGAAERGVIDYSTGVIDFNASMGSASGTASVTYRPAVQIAQQPHTRALPVTVENRRLNWLETLLPIPAPGSLSVSYRAYGNWYTLVDNGNGALSGQDAAWGTGTINYVNGALAVTLGALPDAGTQVMIVWASPVHYEVMTNNASTTLIQRFTLPDVPVIPGSFSGSFISGGVTRNFSANALGVISGDATGTIRYTTGEVELRLTRTPDAGQGFNCTWQQALPPEEAGPAVYITRDFQMASVIDLESPVAPGTLIGRLAYRINIGGRFERARAMVRDDGNGAVITIAGREGRLAWEGDQVIGTVNYSTGVITLGHMNVSYRWWHGEWSMFIDPATADTSDSGFFTFRTGINPIAAARNALIDASLRVDLLSTAARFIVPGSVTFAVGSTVYVDRNGVLYTNISPTTGGGTPSGSINYETGECILTAFPPGQTFTLQVNSLLARFGDWTTTETMFRTALAPIKPEALSVVATTTAGEQIQGWADADGNISGPKMTGTVNYEAGTARVQFVHNGDPVIVDPSTIRYNAVAYKYLPLDAGILGINAVRLPTDGRVPIYRPGDIVLIMHTAETAPAMVSNGQTISAGRTRLAWVRVIDADGNTVSGNRYTLDRDTGVVTMTNVTGLAQPLRLRHTVADLRMVTDAQVSGDLTLSRPLSHNFPANDSLVASCLIHGDRRARVSLVFDQASWNGAWANHVIGSEATASLNLIDYPIEVTNEGCDTDRWALRFLSSTSFEIISEKRGVIGHTQSIANDCAPINPRTREADGSGGTPYFRIRKEAFGSGWSAGNVIRINTIGAIADFWVARSIQQSDEPMGDGADGCELYALGNIDRP